MKTREYALKRTAEELGSAMILAWTLLLGPLGAIALLAIAYAIFIQNLALGIVSGVLVFAPLMLTVAWGPFLLAARYAEAGLEVRTSPVARGLAQSHNKAV